MWVIQRYYGERNGRPWFVYKYISVPKNKEKYVLFMNKIIPRLFRLPEEMRSAIIGYIVLMNHNNGVNQYFPHLKDYTINGIAEFVNMAIGSNETNLEPNQKIK